MTISVNLERLQALHASGALTAAEYAAAKRAAIAEAGSGPTAQTTTTSLLENRVAALHLEAQLSRADRDWAETRRKLGATEDRTDHTPSYLGSLLSGGFIMAFGGCWYAAITPRDPQPGSIGLGILGLGVTVAILGLIRAGQFHAAQQRHARRRNQLLVQIQQAEGERS